MPLPIPEQEPTDFERERAELLAAIEEGLEKRDSIRQRMLDPLRKDIDVGIRQADAGESTPLDFEAIKASARRRLADQSGPR